MARVIGLDFGNWQAFACSVIGMDEKSRSGGIIEDLLPGTYKENGDGIPNEFFWNTIEKSGKQVSNELYGFAAAKDVNRPQENHVRLLKKHLGEKITLYGNSNRTTSHTFNYDDIIVKMFEYHIKMANDALRENYGEKETTNLVSLAYPASLKDPAHREYFVRLAEKADSGVRDSDGKMMKIKVVGTICEPAAAGLDRLSEQREVAKKDTVTYGVFDLGGGTFDLSIVSLYPNGRQRANGKTYYYDIVVDGKGLNIAGSDFSKCLEEVFISKLKKFLEPGQEPKLSQLRTLKKNVESRKKELSEARVDRSIIFVEADDEEVELVVTKWEFEKAISGLVDEIMRTTKKFFEDYKNQKPDEIIMTGGSSYIPYIKARLEETLPEYKGKIYLHRPSKAAAYGAARFYAEETGGVNGQKEKDGSEKHSGSGGVVYRRVDFDLGTLVRKNDVYSVYTLIPAGTEIPCTSGEHRFVVNGSTSRTDYSIYSANKLNPTNTNVDTDYDMVLDVKLDYGRQVADHTRTSCTLSIDELGIAHIKAWEGDNTSVNVEKNFSIGKNTD